MKFRIAIGRSTLLFGLTATVGQAWALPSIPFLWKEGTMEQEARLAIENCLLSPPTCLLPATITIFENLRNAQLAGFTKPLNGAAAANAETIGVYFGSLSDLRFSQDCNEVYRAYKSDYQQVMRLPAPDDVNHSRCNYKLEGPVPHNNKPWNMIRGLRATAITVGSTVAGGAVEKSTVKYVVFEANPENDYFSNTVSYYWTIHTYARFRPVEPLRFKDVWVLTDLTDLGNTVPVNVPVFAPWQVEGSLGTFYRGPYFPVPTKMTSRIVLSCKDKVTGVLHEISSPINSPGVTGIDGSAYFRTSRTDLTANTELSTLQKNCDTINVRLDNVELLDNTSDASVTVTFIPANAEAQMWEAYSKLLAENVTDRLNIVGLLNLIAQYTGDQRALILQNMKTYSNDMQGDFTTWASSKGYIVNLADYFIANSSDLAMDGIAIYSLKPNNTTQEGTRWGEFVNDLSFPPAPGMPGINSERDLSIHVLNDLLTIPDGSTLSALVASKSDAANKLLDNELGKANYFMTQLVPVAQIGYSKTLCTTANEIKSHLPPPQTYQTCP